MQYISYFGVKDKIYGLNTSINYKNQARCVLSELIVDEKDAKDKKKVDDKNRFEMKNTFEFSEDLSQDDINKEIEGKYKMVLQAIHKLPDQSEIEVFYRYSRALEYRMEYVAMMEEEIKSKFSKKAPGIDEVILDDDVKHDIIQVIDFINKAEKYIDIGAEIPRGFLLYGDPGCGKSLIAKAIAKECGCNFQQYTGGEMSNKYVGTGPNKIKEIFANAREQAPTIIFIDEVDALCISRKDDSNNEDLKTLTQLLSEMDGMNDNEGVFVIGATNQLHLLDDAVLREGRFSRKVEIKKPSRDNRVKMFELYINKLKHEDDLDVNLYADLTDNCNGAKISSICNEAAILAVDRDKTKVSHDEIMYMIDKLMAFDKAHRIKEEEETKPRIGFGV